MRVRTIALSIGPLIGFFGVLAVNGMVDRALLGALLSFCTGFVYFLPTVLADTGRHPATNSIFVVNLFLGWTLIGFVVALAWALNKPEVAQAIAPPPQAAAPSHGEEMACPRCAETIKRAAKVCRFCGLQLPAASPKKSQKGKGLDKSAQYPEDQELAEIERLHDEGALSGEEYETAKNALLSMRATPKGATM